MNPEISFSLFTVLMIAILFLANAYYKQKLINSFLIKEIKIKGFIKLFRQMINKRQSHLDKYDFQRYNLDEALLKQDDIKF